METRKDRVVYFLLAFFFGIFGVHHFYMQNAKVGVIRLLIGATVVLCYISVFYFLVTGTFEASKKCIAPVAIIFIGHLLAVFEGIRGLVHNDFESGYWSDMKTFGNY